mgnify:CR=1 FL=1
MATTRSRYVSKCKEVLAAGPAYQNGASDLKNCDCIGMTKYGLRENNVSFITTGTNYTFRHQVMDKREIHSVADLKYGDVVFKFYKPGDPGYNLPAKYRPGGSEYNGDLNDYYHIGTVESVNPLHIIHMTSPTAKTDTKIGRWGVCASLMPEFIFDDGEDIIINPDPVSEPEIDPVPEGKAMIVYAENGKPVNFRSGPSIKRALVAKVALGETLMVYGTQGEWSQAKYRSKTGWMMSKDLRDPEEPAADPEPVPVLPGTTATVWSANGKPVKLRNKPTTGSSMYDMVPINTVVTVDEYGEKWCRVSYGYRRGWYMMTEYLTWG